MTDRNSTGLSIERPSRAERNKERLMNQVKELDDQVKMNFNLPRSVAKKFKLHCLQQDSNMSDVLRDMITTYLQKSTQQ